MSYVSALPFGKGSAWVTHGLPPAVLGDWTLLSLFSFKRGLPTGYSCSDYRRGHPNGNECARLSDRRTRAPEIQQWFNILICRWVARAINLLDTAHFAMPVTNLARPSVWPITGTQVAGLPRVMQFASIRA